MLPTPNCLRNKLAIAFLFNFSIYFSPSLYPTNYSAIQLQDGLINKLGFFSLWPSWDVFPLLPIFQSHSHTSELPTNTYYNLNAVVILKILTTDQCGHWAIRKALAKELEQCPREFFLSQALVVQLLNPRKVGREGGNYWEFLMEGQVWPGQRRHWGGHGGRRQSIGIKNISLCNIRTRQGILVGHESGVARSSPGST